MSASVPTTSSAHHAETTPLLGEKRLDSDGIQAYTRTRDPQRRFWRALSIATILYVCVEILVIGCIVKFYLAYHPFSKSSIKGPQDDGDKYDCSLHWSDQDSAHGARASWTGDEDLSSTSIWPGPQYSATASFDLPTSAPLLYFLSRGDLIAGSVAYDTTSLHTDKIQVDIEMRYRTKQGRDRTDVCILSKKDGSAGVGIYSHGDIPEGPRSDFLVQFYLKVKFPGTLSNPLKLKDLETRMSLFQQKIGHLEGSVSFDTVYVETANTPISVGSLLAKNIELLDENTPISGRFNVTESLKLSTTNTEIDADVDLNNRGDGSKTGLILSTSNAKIRANLNLYSVKGKEGGHFDIQAGTTNAAIDVFVPVAPQKPHLNLAASTTMGSATVKLPLEYEGSISTSTSWSSTVLYVDTETADPSGNDLKRHVQIIRSTGTSTFANTWWGDDEGRKELGKVEVSTSFGKVAVEA